MRTHQGDVPHCTALCMAASAIQVLALALTLVFAACAQAQISAPAPTSPLHSPATFDLDRDREHSAVLDGLWRFHTGDDPRWADPSFDDSNWPLVRSDRSWSDQGYKKYGGTAWYRVKILIPEGEKPLSLYLPRVLTSYQIFADGQLVATFGGMPPREHANYSAMPQVYALPRNASANAHMLSIAIRVWHPPHWAMYFGGGILGGIRIGESSLVQNRSILEIHEQAWNQMDGILLAMLETLAGLAALALFALRTQEREYLWFGIWLILSAAIRGLFVYTGYHPIGRIEHDLIWQLLFLLETLASIAFYFRLLHGKRDWLFWSGVGATIANLLLLSAGLLELISVALWIEIGSALTLPVAVWIVSLLIRRTIEGLPDARLLLAPVLLQQLVAVVIRTLNLGLVTGWYHFPSLDWLYETSDWPFRFTLTDVADALFLIAMLAILLYRFSRTRRQEESYGREREAARTVQQVLIPEAVPPVPGFTIASVYKPAGEVGGDFFQVLPIESGGVLMVIGDVSGKGLPAAMTVSLLVGTVRTLAHYTNSPGEMLTAMNQRMLARSNGGFTTCLILRADSNGTLTIANAGHISPYKSGAELELENGLPLGLAPANSYAESVFQLVEEEQLTLVTDGVVEARNRSGGLFGFERTQSISTKSAESIAMAAQEFGQEDDITAVTLTRLQPITEISLATVSPVEKEEATRSQ